MSEILDLKYPNAFIMYTKYSGVEAALKDCRDKIKSNTTELKVTTTLESDLISGEYYNIYLEKLGEWIAINEQFVINPSGNYSLDKVIDTINHEMRYQYQYEQKDFLGFSELPEDLKNKWNDEYIKYDSEVGNYGKYYNQPVEFDTKAFSAISSPDLEEEE